MNPFLRTISLSILLFISLAVFAVPLAQARPDGQPPLGTAPAAPVQPPVTPGGAAATPATGAPQIKLKSWFIKNADGTDMTLKQLIISTIPNFLISFVGFTFIVFFLVNAVRYLIGAGDTESTTAAKHGMLSAIIGIIVVLVAYGAVFVVNNWIGS